ncbi:chitin binding peritrophin-A domain-containing protein [Streptomyces sp. NPDC054904]|uniref:chitin binding peritrophin-A domain-containing protein n=1 Tax=unclassified Streptomyces TaxID=2593676 RepID=UPI002481A9C5|nr:MULTISPECIES: chitin binding peritrophin-A domain-containing protein [unclassified Streptomyces]MDA5285393.1 chitin binding domain-containing protein [Streptomyces sp. Isolate_45]MDX2392293.1 chitin binding domain-containing protein [Streptomyces sp. DK15]
MVSRIHRGIAATAAGALLALGLAAAPAVGAAGVGGCGAEGRLPRPQDHRFYVQCAAGIATVHACPTGQVFSPGPQICDTPDRVRPAAATVAGAGPAKLNGLLFGVKNLNATVRIVDAPAGLDGVPVTFTTIGGRQLCTAVTDQFGAARCDSPPRLTVPLDEILRGYRATYAGIGGIYLASSATAPVHLL